MSLLQISIARKPCTCTLPLSALNTNPNSRTSCFFSLQILNFNPSSSSHYSSIFSSASSVNPTFLPKPRPLFAISLNSDSSSGHDPDSKPKTTRRRGKTESPRDGAESSSEIFPTTIPRKPRRGRRSEAVAVEDFVRDSLDRTFESIRKQNAEVLENKEKVLKERFEDEVDSDDDNDDDKHRDGKKAVVEEDDLDWPLDADVGWGTRASEYFEKHPIRNVVGEDGVEIDWEGEIDDNWVKEINCLEWESFAFHPSPLIVLVFERYERATDNWRLLKELERAIQVYWNAKDRLPPRTVKIDINIERDLAYALKVKECPQLLFLRGNKILYREKDIRTTDEIVNMIAYFYYNAKKPSWIDDAALAP